MMELKMFLHLLSEQNSRFSESQDIVCRVCIFLSMNTHNIMFLYIYVKWSKWHPSTDQEEADLGDFCQSLRLLGSMDKLGMTCLASSTSFQFLSPFQSVVSNELACCKALSNMANLIDMMRLRDGSSFLGRLGSSPGDIVWATSWDLVIRNRWCTEDICCSDIVQSSCFA